jgi:hypothetical protein
MAKRMAALCQVYQHKILKSFSSERGLANWREIPPPKNGPLMRKTVIFSMYDFL